MQHRSNRNYYTGSVYFGDRGKKKKFLVIKKIFFFIFRSPNFFLDVRVTKEVCRSNFFLKPAEIFSLVDQN